MAFTSEAFFFAHYPTAMRVNSLHEELAINAVDGFHLLWYQHHVGSDSL